MDSTLRNTVVDSFPGTIILAYHTPFVSPFNDYPGSCVYSLYPYMNDTSAFPNGLGYGVNYENIYDTVEALYGQTTPVSIDINSKTWDPEKRIVNLELAMTNDGDNLEGSYRYTIVVTEDSIIHGHTTKDSCSTPDSISFHNDSDYINSWVTRKLVYCSDGELLIQGGWPASNTIKRYASFSLHPAWLAENCNVTVYIFKRNLAGYEPPLLYESPIMQAIQESIIDPNGFTDYNHPKTGVLRIFPNPSKAIANIHIAITEKGLCTLNIYNINGQKVKTLHHGNRSPGLYNVEFETNSLPSGTYIVVMETKSGKTSQKLIIQ